MADPQFNVVAAGRLLQGFVAEQVLEQLHLHLKLPAPQAGLLLAGQPVVIKKAVPEAIAQAYCRRLTALGVETSVQPLAAVAALGTPLPGIAAAPTGVATTLGKMMFFLGSLGPLKGRSSPAYLHALLQVLSTTALLVLAYCLLPVLLLAVMTAFAVHFAYLLHAPPVVFSASVYLLPLLLSLIPLVFLLRPFLFRRQSHTEALLVSAAAEPRLHQFIAQLCASVSTPLPQDIYVNCGADGEGTTVALRSFWRGSYVLTIDLPTLQNLTMPAMAGQLARTLGQSAKPLSQRCSFALRGLTRQLEACCDNRDTFALTLSRWTSGDTTPAPLVILANAAQLGLNQSTHLLRALLQKCRATEQSLARGELLEADRYQSLVAGSAAFVDTLLAVQKLQLAAQSAHAKNLEDRGDNGFVDNLPALIRHYFENIDDKFTRDLRRQWDESVARSKSDFTEKKRIERALAANNAGLIEAASQAPNLLVDAASLDARATRLHYKNLGLRFEEHSLLPVDTLVYAASEDLLQRQQAESYFNGWLRPQRFWSLPDYALIRDMPAPDAAQQLNVCVNEIRRLSPDREKSLAEFDKLQNQIRELQLGQIVVAAGGRFNFRYIQYDGGSLQPQLDERLRQLDKVVEQLSMQETIMGGRLTLGLRLSGQITRDINDVHTALTALRGLESRLYKFAEDVYLLEQLTQRHYQQREPKYALPLTRLEQKIKDAGNLLVERLKTIPYPLNRRYNSLKAYMEGVLRKHEHSGGNRAGLARAQTLLQSLYTTNEKLNLLAADFGTIAEEAYQIERIRLIATEQGTSCSN